MRDGKCCGWMCSGKCIQTGPRDTTAKPDRAAKEARRMGRSVCPAPIGRYVLPLALIYDVVLRTRQRTDVSHNGKSKVLARTASDGCLRRFQDRFDSYA